jgi:hypothetical protein
VSAGQYVERFFFLSFGFGTGCVTSAGCASANHPDPTNSVGYASSIAFDANMCPRISYYNPLLKRLHLAICNDPECSTGNVGDLIEPNSSNDIGSENDIAVNKTTNMIYVVAYDATDDVLAFSYPFSTPLSSSLSHSASCYHGFLFVSFLAEF